jgi:hypothetical protein
VVGDSDAVRGHLPARRQRCLGLPTLHPKRCLDGRWSTGQSRPYLVHDRGHHCCRRSSVSPVVSAPAHRYGWTGTRCRLAVRRSVHLRGREPDGPSSVPPHQPSPSRRRCCHRLRRERRPNRRRLRPSPKRRPVRVKRPNRQTQTRSGRRSPADVARGRQSRRRSSAMVPGAAALRPSRRRRPLAEVQRQRWWSSYPDEAEHSASRRASYPSRRGPS